MEYCKLGDSDLCVSRIAFGCEQLGGVDWGHFDRTAVKHAIERALELGINLFDTADVYALGGSEEALAEALGESRHKVIIATKVGVNWESVPGAGRANTFIDLRPERVLCAIEESLRRLRIETIGLYLLHRPDPTTPLEETLGVLSDAQRAGKIRNIGVSNFEADQIREAHSILHLCTAQISYNLLNRAVEDEIIPCCKELGIGIVVYGPLAQGLLTGKYGKDKKFESNDRRSRLAHFQGEALDRNLILVERLMEISQRHKDRSPSQVALRWLLDKNEISSVITGVKTPEQIQDNVGAIGWRLSASETADLSDIEENKL